MLSQIIESRRHSDRLVHGYQDAKAVSYVVSPDLLLSLFQDYGFAQAEIIVGEIVSGTSLADHTASRRNTRRSG